MPANYWRKLNKSTGKIHINIGANKNVQKHWRPQNLGVNKSLATTKHWHIQKLRHRQIIGVNKTLAHIKTYALTNYGHQQNIDTCKILAHGRTRRQLDIGIRQCLVQEKVGGDAEEWSYC